MNKIIRELEPIFINSCKYKKKLKKNFINFQIGNPEMWDSINHVNFLLNIENKFKIKFNEKEFINSNSIKKIINIIKKKKK